MPGFNRTVLDLAEALAAGRTSSRELVEAALARVAAPDGEGAREAPPNWWTPLLSSEGSGKVSNESGPSSIYG
jgi:hypothetical protein